MNWDESQHPRDDHGKFSSGGGGESSGIVNAVTGKPIPFFMPKFKHTKGTGIVNAHGQAIARHSLVAAGPLRFVNAMGKLLKF